MQITINQSEIKEAIVKYVGTQGISLIDKKIEITLTAGRGPNGMTADINLIPQTEEKLVENTAISREAELENTTETEETEEKAEEAVNDSSALFGSK